MMMTSYNGPGAGWMLQLLTFGVAIGSLVAGQVHDFRADGGQTVVLFNHAMPESRELAEYYAQARGIPPDQMIGLDLPVVESMSRGEFRDLLEGPLMAELLRRDLFTGPGSSAPVTRVTEVAPWIVSSKVRYLTLCYGVPLKITRDPTLTEYGQNRLPEQLRRNESSVDSELVLLPANLRRLPVVGPLANPVYSQTNLTYLSPTNGVWVVGRLDGPTPAIARGLVDKAIQAETNGLWGRAYVDLRGLTNTASILGDQWLHAFGDVVRRIGFETVTDTRPETFPQAFPMSQIAFYAGWYDAEVSGPFSRSRVEFMPGAIAYHLHSFNALSVRTANRHWVGPLLAKGATATIGTVEEPYLELTANMGTFAAVLIGFGYSFGEAALVAQPVLSWQTTVVGDPLYRPFGFIGPGEHVGARFTKLHEELTRQQSPLLAWAYLQLVNFQIATGLDPARLTAELQRHLELPRSSILQEKLGDLYFQLGKLGDARRAYDRALKLELSPLQKIRVQLTLAQLHGLLGREREALDQYATLLRDTPEYPDPLGIYRLMLPLAQLANDKERIAQIQAEIERLSPLPPPTPASSAAPR